MRERLTKTKRQQLSDDSVSGDGEDSLSGTRGGVLSEEDVSGVDIPDAPEDDVRENRYPKRVQQPVQAYWMVDSGRGRSEATPVDESSSEEDEDGGSPEPAPARRKFTKTKRQAVSDASVSSDGDDSPLGTRGGVLSEEDVSGFEIVDDTRDGLANDAESEDDPRSRVGGESPIIIPPGKIALLTLDSASESDLERRYLYQALEKISTGEIFEDLLERVSENKPDWKETAEWQDRLPEDERAIDESAISRLRQVDDDADIVVLDGEEFPPDALGPVTYTSLTHTIQVGLPEESDEESQLDNTYKNVPFSDYWRYLKGALFELCNASQRDLMLKVDHAAEEGELDCVSFVLVQEIMEQTSCELFDRLWGELSQDPGFSTVVDPETGQSHDVQAPDWSFAKLGTTRVARLKNSIAVGHAVGYIKQWKANYLDAHEEKQPTEAEEFQQWIDDESDFPPGVDPKDRIGRLGVNVKPAEVQAVMKHVQRWYKNPWKWEVEAESDPDYSA